MAKKQIAIIYPYFLSGGGESVTAWFIKAFESLGRVNLFTCDKVDIDFLNKSYGVNISKNDVEIINPPFSWLLRNIPGCGLLKYHFLLRNFKKNKDKFNVVIGTYKEADFGKKGIQYIHFPELNHDLKNLGFFAKIYYKYSFLRNFYKNFCYWISDFEIGRMRNNITFTNSNWTKRMIKKNMGVDSIVLYPPVLDDFKSFPWDKKKNAFVCVSRISPEKRIKLVIEVIKEVRLHGHDLSLHIIGSAGDKPYFKEIKEIEKQNKWIKIDGFMNRESFISIVSQYKYGIHGRKDEHFGISVAEMVKSGCIVFVPNDGGQTEIVNSEELVFCNKEDAIEKIIDVLENGDKQSKIRKNLFKNSNKFSIEEFKNLIKETALKEI